MVLSLLVFFPLLAAIGGSDLVLLFSGLGGLSGLAALATVFVNHKAGIKKAEQDDKSVAIVELEKAVPGLGEIIREWQGVVHQLQEDHATTKKELEFSKSETSEYRKDNRELKDQLNECQARLTVLEGKS